jgi:hypothetical protein
MKTFQINGHAFTAADCVDGVLIDPELPEAFDETPNEDRPASQQKWWHRPFIVTDTIEQMDAFYAGRTDEYAEQGRKSWAEEHRAKWMAAWPSGARYETRCLDGGAWDRSTHWGHVPYARRSLALCENEGSASLRKDTRPLSSYRGESVAD